MKSAFFVPITLLALVVRVPATDYCAQNLCWGLQHIACGNNGSFATACPVGQTQLVPMTQSLKDLILHSHNSKRNTIAGGNLPGFSPAVQMATMKWDNTLALLASYNVKTCVFAHDQCRKTDEYSYSGQNLAKFRWYGSNHTDESIIAGQIDDWWGEYVDATMAQLQSYPSSPSKTIGHFTVITAGKNIALGCSAIRFHENGWSTFIQACNYARTNIINRAFYKSGVTASECVTGNNINYPALCSVTESYDPNSI